MSEHVNVPACEEVAQKLRQLIAGEITREAASNWATPWVTQLENQVRDLKAHQGLVALAGADMISTDRPYLYGQLDFEKWLDELTR